MCVLKVFATWQQWVNGISLLLEFIALLPFKYNHVPNPVFSLLYDQAANDSTNTRKIVGKLSNGIIAVHTFLPAICFCYIACLLLLLSVFIIPFCISWYISICRTRRTTNLRPSFVSSRATCLIIIDTTRRVLISQPRHNQHAHPFLLTQQIMNPHLDRAVHH